MRTFGADRHRVAGERVVLLSAISKGWTARVAKTGTSAEYPGTAVLWDDAYFEVVEAVAADGGRVRYVLAPWRDDHTIRTFEVYDEETEARRVADHQLAQKQQRASAVSRWSSMILGHLPGVVQHHLENELGLFPARMTMFSAIPPAIVFTVCLGIAADAMMKQEPPPIATPLLLFCGLWFLESFIRFFLAMTQQRGFGSIEGTVGYLLFRALSPNRDRWPALFARGKAAFTLPPEDDVAFRDALEMKGPLLTLLSAREQQLLASRGFDYRRHAFPLTWVLLVSSLLGAITSYVSVSSGASGASLLSMFIAAAVAVEQVLRLVQLQRGPAPSVFGALVRPFVRDVFR